MPVAATLSVAVDSGHSMKAGVIAALVLGITLVSLGSVPWDYWYITIPAVAGLVCLFVLTRRYNRTKR